MANLNTHVSLTAMIVAGGLLIAPSTAVAEVMVAEAAQAQNSQTRAQEEEAAGPPADGAIIVTARRREESLLEVPSAVTVLGETLIRDLNLTDIVDVAILTPGLTMQDNSRQNEQPFIRGMSVNSFFRDAQSASFFHDGIFVGGVARTIGDDDVERIEVVRGPQAVYFGRQTFSGAINYVTRKPTFDFQAHLRAEVAENNRMRLSGGVSGPIVDDLLAVRLYAQIGTDDGAFQNTLDRFRVQPEETVGGSASVTFRPSPDISFTARAQKVEFDDGHNASTLLGAGLNNCLPNARGVNQAFCGRIPTPDTIALNLTNLEFPGGRRTVSQERYSLIGSIDIGGFELSTITAFNSESNINSADGDGTPRSVFRFTFRSEYDDFTQQLILNSPQDQPLRFLLGAIYFESERIESSLTFPLNIPSDPRLIENTAIFAGIEYDLTEALTVGLEGRYSWDRVERQTAGLGRTFKSFLPRVTVDYKLSEDTLLYAVVSRGNQPGDFNTNAGVTEADRVIEEQKIWNYELGLRHAFDNRRGLIAANLFHIDWTDQVVQATVPAAPGFPTPTVIINVNAGRSRIYGLELEGSYAWSNSFTTRATYAYNNAEYVDFISRIPLSYGGNQQVGGNRLQNTPEHTASFAATYSQKFSQASDWGMFASAVYTYRSGQFLDETNTAEIGSTSLVNAQLGIENDNVRVSLFGRNLLDTDTPAFATRFSDFSRGATPSYLITLREPRYFGVRVDFKY